MRKVKDNWADWLPDTGCTAARKFGYKGPCLECPFDTCVEDFKSATQKPKHFRYFLINQDLLSGLSPASVREKYHVSLRTIYRAKNRHAHLSRFLAWYKKPTVFTSESDSKFYFTQGCVQLNRTHVR